MESFIEFEAEIVEVKAKKTVSVDKEFTIKIVTDNKVVLDLQRYIADKSVTIKVYDER